MKSMAIAWQPVFDVGKWLVVCSILVAGIWGNSYYADESLLYRALALAGLAVLGALIALQTRRGRAVKELIGGSRIEIRKVVWPTRDETVRTTLIVLLLVVVVALILWLLDWLLGMAAEGVIG